MDAKRRTIEIDEDLAVALERRAAERGLSLERHIVDIAEQEATVVLPPEELAELDARVAEWEREGLGYEADDVFRWLRSRIEGGDARPPKLKRF